MSQGKSPNAIAPRAKMKIKILVRDKHGNPKIDSKDKIPLFADQLTEADMKYLEDKFS